MWNPSKEANNGNHKFYNFRSIGPYQLKHWLSQFGFTSQVIDFCQLMTADEIMELIAQFVGPETTTLGCSTTFWPYDSDPTNLVEVIARCRDKYPNLRIIGGGQKFPVDNSLFDKFFGKYSEDTLADWLLSSSNHRVFDITKLQHRFDTTDCISDYEVLPIELGRGCVFKCEFCSTPNIGKEKSTYQRQFQLILDEMRWNKEQFGTTKYCFLDDTINEDHEKVINLSNLPQSLGFDIEWTGYLRADLIWARKEEELLLRSGMKSCFFGIETFNQDAGKAIHKGWGAKYGKEYLPALYHDHWKEAINIHCNFIVGLPGETWESLTNTFEWCKQTEIGLHNFNALNLSQDKTQLYTSEFERNSVRFGFKNIKVGYWEHPTMNSKEARLSSHKYNIELDNHTNRLSAWRLFNAVNLNVPVQVAKQWMMSDYNNFYATAISTFKQNYINKLKVLKE
jgi:hypothetical protein